jgi:hypothetical protein
VNFFFVIKRIGKGRIPACVCVEQWLQVAERVNRRDQNYTYVVMTDYQKVRMLGTAYNIDHGSIY